MTTGRRPRERKPQTETLDLLEWLARLRTPDGRPRRATIAQLAEVTGRPYTPMALSLTRCLRRGLVSRRRTSRASYPGPWLYGSSARSPWSYQITRAGEEMVEKYRPRLDR